MERFMRYTGMPIAMWVLFRKSFRDHLVSVLGFNKKSATDIAGLCGYSNASKFSAAFSRVTGMPPGEWRRKMKC